MNESDEKCLQNSSRENLKGRNPVEDLDIKERTI
jgi:hypothetical protein